MQDLANISGGPRVRVLCGLGGCGKTRIALEFAYESQRQGVDVWWVSAADSSRLVAGMHAVGRRLGVNEADMLHGEAADLMWLQLGRRGQKWLLVIDAADDPQLLAGAGSSVGDGMGWLRPIESVAGLVVVTSRDGRSSSWGAWCHLHHITMLGTEEAMQVLADRAGERHERLGGDGEALRLADRLGGLPLALKIAGSFLAESAAVPIALADPGQISSYNQYRQAINAGQLDIAFPDPGSNELTAEQVRGLIGRTWELTLDLLDARRQPEPRRILRLLACLADAPIPYELLLRPARLADSSLFPGMSGARLWDVLQTLAGFGLIDLTSQDDVPAMARVHPLVRDTSRPRPDATADDDGQYLVLASQLVVEAAEAGDPPEEPTTWPMWQALTPHAIHVFMTLKTSQVFQVAALKAAAHAAWMAARYQSEQGLYASAEAVHRDVLAVQLEILGADDPDTLATSHEIASVMSSRGESDAARSEFRRVLADRIRILGADNSRTLDTRHQLAMTLAESDPSEAEIELRDVMAAQERVLGADHPDTLSTWHDIAYVMGAQDDHAGAEAVFREVLAAQVRVQGANHPSALTARHNIAAEMAAQGDHAGAEAQYRDVLAAKLSVRGSSHPSTLTTRLQIAFEIAAKGDHAGAEAQYRDIFTVQKRVLGKEHPDTLFTSYQVAAEMAAQGNHSGAEAQYREVLSVEERVRGEEHFSVLATRYRVAAEMAAQGDHAGAEAENRAVLTALERVRGEDHSDTLTVRSQIAAEMAAQGDHAGAEAQYRDIFTVQKRVLGEEHPDTLFTSYQVAAEMAAQGNHSGAEAQYREVLSVEERVRGEEHPDTLVTSYQVAAEMAAQGNHAGAEAQYRDIFTVQKRVLGEEHPDTLVTRYQVAAEMAAQGDHAGAEAQYRDIFTVQKRVLGKEHPDTLVTRYQVAAEMAAQGNHSGAEAEYRELLRAYKRRGSAARDIAAVLVRLAEVYRDLGRPDEALRGATEAVQVLKASPEVGPRARAEVLVFAARLQIQSDPGQAIPFLEEAAQLLGPEQAADPLERVTVLDLLAAAHRALGREAEAREAAAAADGILAGSAASFNISWPWNGDENDIASTADEIRNGRLYVVLNPGAKGLRFNRRLARFTEGPRYKDLDVGQRHQSPGSRRRDGRPLVISLPYLEGSIEKVTYVVNDDVLTLIVVPASPGVKFRPGDVEFFRELPLDYTALPDDLLAAAADEALAGKDAIRLLALGLALIEHQELERAGAAIERAKAVLQSRPPGEVPAMRSSLARALDYLGRAHEDNRAYAQALAAYREALELTGAEADPVFYGVVLHDIADVHRARGELDEAARVYQQALEHKRRGSADPDDIAETARALGVAYGGLGRGGQEGAYAQALAAYREALELTGAEADPVFYGVVLHDIADVHRARGELDEAARVYQQALEHKRRGDGSPRDRATTARALGVAYEGLGRGGQEGAYAQALAAYREALELTGAEADPVFYGVVLHDIADVHRARGELDEAARVYQQALEHKRRGDGSPRDRATTARALGVAYEGLGRGGQEGAYAQALAAYREALELTGAEADPVFYGVVLHDIADVHRARGELDEAARVYQQALEHKRRGSADPDDIAETARALGVAYGGLGRGGQEGAYAQALAAYREALELTGAEADPVFYGVVLHDIADVHRARGELDEAARVYQQALEHKRRGSADPDDIAETARALGVAYGGLGRGGQEGAYAQALAAYREALELTGAEADPVFYGVVLHDIADVHRARGELDEAARVYQQALEHKRRGDGSPRDRATTARALGVAYEGLGRGGQEGAYAQALAAYREALELTGAEADPVFYGVVLHDIADVHRARGELDEAARVYQQALEHKRRGSAARDIAAVLVRLAEVYRDLGRPDEALRGATEAVQVLKASPEVGPRARAEVLVFAARLQIQSDPGQAIPFLEEAAQLLGPEQAADPLERVTVLDLLAAAHRALGREAEAREAAAAADGILAGRRPALISRGRGTVMRTILPARLTRSAMAGFTSS